MSEMKCERRKMDDTNFKCSGFLDKMAIKQIFRLSGCRQEEREKEEILTNYRRLLDGNKLCVFIDSTLWR